MNKFNKGWILVSIFIVLIGIYERQRITDWIPYHLTDDSKYYHVLAYNLAQGNGFSLKQGDSYRAVHEHTPGYALFLSAWYRWLNMDEGLTNESSQIKMIIMVQQGMIVVAGLIFAWAWQKIWHNKRLTFIYLAIFWTYLPFVVAGNFLLSETLGIFLWSGVFMGLVRQKSAKEWWWAALTGLGLGLLVLVRPAMIVVWPAFGLWVAVYAPRLKTDRTRLMGVTLGLLLPLVIWVMRTGVTTKYWVPIQTGVGWVLMDGGCPSSVCGIDYRRLPIPMEPRLRPVAGPETSLKWENIWWWYNVKKIRSLLGLPFGDTDWRRNSQNTTAGRNILVVSHTLLLGLMVVGGIKALRLMHLETLPVIVLSTGIVAHSLFWSEPRYALLYMPLVIGMAVRGGEVIWRHRDDFKLWERKNFGLWALGLIVGWGLIVAMGGPSEWIDKELRTGLHLMLWTGLLVIFCKVGLGGRKSMTWGQRLVTGWFVVLMWGMMIGLWQPLRQVMWPQAPKNDYPFPVGVSVKEIQWL